MKGKKPLILIVLVVALLAVALILPAGAVAAPAGQPLGFASWGGTLANLIQPNPNLWPPDGVVNVAWSVEVRQLSLTETVGRLNMNVVQNPDWPSGVYSTKDIVWSVFLPGDPSEAYILFEWGTFPWVEGGTETVYNLVYLADAARNGQDYVGIFSYVGWIPTIDNWLGTWNEMILPFIPAWGVKVVGTQETAG